MEPLQNSSIESSEYRDLPLAQLVESSTNPRKHYDQGRLAELAESIRAQTVLEPLLVRQLSDERFEIIAGSRRFRAAQLAGADKVPARILALSDADTMLAQLTENGQREDIHPLHEAYGFRAVLELPNQQFDIATIAAKAGRTPQYVTQRLKLTELIPDVAEAFLAERLTIGHALLIAKLPPEQQHEAFKATFKSTWIGSGQAEVLVAIRDLAAWIESNLLLDLDIASFDRSDASLVSDAGSCHDCSKRTGANNLLFPESKRDHCLDRSCFQAKVAAHVKTTIDRSPGLIQISSGWGTHADGVLGRAEYVEIAAKSSRNGHGKLPPERKTCAHITKAIVVDGGNLGRVVDVCADPACETHHAESRKAREALERTRSENRKQLEHRKQEMATRNRVLAAILERITVPLGKADLELILREYLSRLPQELRTTLAQRHTPASANGNRKKGAVEVGAAFKNLDEAGYSRLLIEISLFDAVYSTHSREDAERLEATAKRYRVNVSKIAESVAAECSARQKKREDRRAEGANAPAPKNGRKRKRA